MTTDYGYWERVKLQDMSDAQWEALCDGCGKCCLNKLEDEDTGEILYTRVACRLLDIKRGRCSDYENRLSQVPDCLNLRELADTNYHWLPATCAYRLVAEGQDLPEWHHLKSGRPGLVHKATCSVRGRAIPETDVDPDKLHEYVIQWVDR